MTYSYEFLAEVALADVAFVVRADSWAELFIGAAEALAEVMVSRQDLGVSVTHSVSVEEESIGEALHAFLSEIVYLKDAQSFLPHHADLLVDEGPPATVTGRLIGDVIDAGRQALGQDVKAITYHMFEVTRDSDRFQAQVVLDI